MATRRFTHVEVDTQMLISLVEERPELWDPSANRYRDRDLRAKLWDEICEAMFPSPGMDLAEKQNCLDRIQRRWKNTRDSYFKSCNKGKKPPRPSTTPLFKRYMYQEKLRFLDRVRELSNDYNATREADGEDPIFVPIKEESSSDIFLDEDAESMIEEEPERKKSRENMWEENVKIIAPECLKRNTTDERTLEQSLLLVLKDQKDKDEDDNRHFLLSLLPFLKDLTEDQKLSFRLEVMSLITRIKKSAQKL